jgi:hypothetical protein
MRKFIPALAAVAVLAVPAAASANVAVDANGTGFVGKGDVQNALDYHNDAAFQKDALKATFAVDGNRTNITMAVNCQKLDGTVHEIAADLGYIAENETTVTSTPKGTNGKVTGYNLTGVTTSGWTAHLDASKKNGLLSCPAGETFHSWGGATPGNWIFTPVTGSGDLTVTIGSKTAALPNTPVVA